MVDSPNRRGRFQDLASSDNQSISAMNTRRSRPTPGPSGRSPEEIETSLLATPSRTTVRSQAPVPVTAPGGNRGRRPPAKKTKTDNPLTQGPTQLLFPEAPSTEEVGSFRLLRLFGNIFLSFSISRLRALVPLKPTILSI